VLQGSIKRMQDSLYFGKIAADLDDGGLSNLLHFLQSMDLTLP
jgi:hypothetical protein